MSPEEMPKVYDPSATEQRLYDWWEAKGYFRPVIDPSKRPWTITMPPPNITGALHLGQAITATVEDLMTRYHRMRGEPTLYLPGADHAGIATQNVVERELAKRGVTRQQLGRDEFVRECWKWKEVYHARITGQHRRLGVSCDWERERFTLDEGLSRAVRTAFVRLYEQGLIYRGTRLVNWCPRCTSAISDLEVEHAEADTHLWYVRYPLISERWPGPRADWGSGHWADGATEYIQVATTRPETILGDSAVAVNPEDERFKALHGSRAVLPALGRQIPIIADSAVDPGFGTGAVKVTPAHDPTDYEIGQRHKLGEISVMTDTGTMSTEAGPYAGQDRLECRRNLVADLNREGLLVKIEDYRHSAGHCQRCRTLVEPRISTQWFVKIKPLAEPALAAIREGRIRIVPERFNKVYFNWMENIRDWCVSRQLWWGHRIPVWYCDECGAQTSGLTDPTRCGQCGSANIRQDPDVLDTWFSSGLWPFSTLGWPDDTADMRYFYPTTMRETAYDILFFWVAKEIMLGLAMTGTEPFTTVYLHGLIRTAYGAKVSKSLPDMEKYDPIYLIERYSADALRFALCVGATPGNDMRLSVERVEGARNFANKIWNATRYLVTNLGNGSVPADPWALRLELVDRWILSRHNALIADVTRLIDEYQFGEAARQLYEFLWGEYCDWYIEATKPRLYGSDEGAKAAARSTLVYVLERTLRLLHPFMPFATEEVWQHIPHAGEALIVAPWPEPGRRDEQTETEMGAVMAAVRAIRNARAEYGVEPSRRIEALIATGASHEAFAAQRRLLVTLCRLDDSRLVLAPSVQRPEKALALVLSGVEVYLPLAGMVDLERERARLNKELADVDRSVDRTKALLAKPGFVDKAPDEVVEREREKLAELAGRREKLAEQLRVFAG